MMIMMMIAIYYYNYCAERYLSLNAIHLTSTSAFLQLHRFPYFLVFHLEMLPHISVSVSPCHRVRVCVCELVIAHTHAMVHMVVFRLLPTISTLAIRMSFGLSPFCHLWHWMATVVLALPQPIQVLSRADVWSLMVLHFVKMLLYSLHIRWMYNCHAFRRRRRRRETALVEALTVPVFIRNHM